MKVLDCEDINNFKEFLESCEDDNFVLDLRSKSFFESMKFAVLSSDYFYRKYPRKKLKCFTKFSETESFLSAFSIQNLEFV